MKRSIVKVSGGKDSVGLIPLTELGAGKYKEEDGGLYGGGKNEPPPAHAAAAQIDALLNDATPTLADGRVLNMRRTQSTSMSEPLGGETYQHVGGYYLIQASENS